MLPAAPATVPAWAGCGPCRGSRFGAAPGRWLAWATGIWLYFLVIGLLASSLTVFLADNPLFADLAAQAGFGSLTTVAGYLASLFALLAVPLGLFAAGRVAAGDADEEARRLTVVFAAPVTASALVPAWRPAPRWPARWSWPPVPASPPGPGRPLWAPTSPRPRRSAAR